MVSQEWLSLLQEICELLTTRRGPTEFNFEIPIWWMSTRSTDHPAGFGRPICHYTNENH